MDYIIKKDENPYLIEINLVLGIIKESIVPQVFKHEDVSIDKII